MDIVNTRRIDPKNLDVESFLASWFGSGGSVAGIAESDLAWLPEGLRKWFDLISRWKIPLSGAKKLLLPSEMMEEEGKCIFMGDHGGWSWAFDPDAPMTVYEAEDDGPWRPLSGTWADIFFYHAFTEAIWSAPVVKWSSSISESDLGRVLHRCNEVAFGDSGWPGPGWRWYAAEGLIADAGPRVGYGGLFAITIGAMSEEMMEHLDLPGGIDWRVRENR